MRVVPGQPPRAIIGLLVNPFDDEQVWSIGALSDDDPTDPNRHCVGYH